MAYKAFTMASRIHEVIETERKVNVLVLDFGFLWTDLVCYLVGITINALTEFGLVYLRGKTRDSLAR